MIDCTGKRRCGSFQFSPQSKTFHGDNGNNRVFVCLFVCFGRGYIFLFFSDWLWKANVRENGNDSFLVLLELGSTDFIFCQESNKCEIL